MLLLLLLLCCDHDDDEDDDDGDGNDDDAGIVAAFKTVGKPFIAEIQQIDPGLGRLCLLRRPKAIAGPPPKEPQPCITRSGYQLREILPVSRLASH